MVIPLSGGQAGERGVPMILTARRAVTAFAALAIPASLVLAGQAATASSGAAHPQPGFTVRQIVNGTKLHHHYTVSGTRKTEPLSQPDDLTHFGAFLFTAFQNGVGPQGEPSTDGNTNSTVVEFTPSGRVIRQWDIKGKCDGVTADPVLGKLIATVNEDANSSLYTIDPLARTGGIQHYAYNEPLPHNGGTDAITIFEGQIFISASAPGTTGAPAPQPTYPAVYSVALGTNHVATVTPLFGDEASATVANIGPGRGTKVKLALTDPDSNFAVPWGAPRFAGDFELTSQGDKQQIYAQSHDGALRLLVLNLSQSVDDTAWITGDGQLFAADHDGDTVDRVNGDFKAGSIFVAATPCDAGNAPPTCPAPGFPPNYLGTLGPWTGHVSKVTLAGPRLEPQGLMFLPAGH
jgi:hypothetical protein